LRFTEVSFRFWPRRRHSAPFPAGECLHSAATGRPRERSGSPMARSRARRSPGGAPSTRPQAQFARDEKKAQQSLCRAATIGSSGRHAMWAPYTPTCGAGRRPTLPAATRWRLSSRRLVEREAVSGALRYTSPLLADRNDARAGQRCRHLHPGANCNCSGSFSRKALGTAFAVEVAPSTLHLRVADEELDRRRRTVVPPVGA
jgi:hypothetical protein